MKILAALFIDDISMFENHDGLTRLNLSGVQFTIAVSDPFPLTLAPHLVVLIQAMKPQMDLESWKLPITLQKTKLLAMYNPCK
ncbi:MAG: hypothetical protein Ct9H90mP11_09010 [Acidimicrobiales bacterium]|nr:MAG: hypothetical protein Ct9H90mP11_09010 [Acidimicrobiales bacterium]